MKKFYKKILLMLILCVMFFQLMLPTSFALTDWEIFEGTKVEIFGETFYHFGLVNEFIPERTGWYKQSWLGTLDSAYAVFYFDEEGNKKYPTKKLEWDSSLLTSPHIATKVYLQRGRVYYKDTDDLTLAFDVEGSIFTELEAMIADFIYDIASGFHYLIASALGEVITIDDLVFNNYEETNISFFKSSATGKSKLIYGDGELKGLNSVVSDWYAIFMKIALMGYMVILVYMGVRVMFSSTAEKKADHKKLFTDWVIGLAILLLFPYAMKYMIKINDAFVETIEANKGYADAVTGQIASEMVDYDKNPTDYVVDEEIDWSKGTDYISKIALVAYQNQKIALSMAFLMVTWQLVTLIFHYYKRVFMIAFLIVIFPLVAFSYAIDKVADGKSQAFNTWLKEFMLNVFVQTFHAIVFVFVASTVYSASGMGGSIGFDYILIIVGTHFLFSGEAIIRQIFGQVSAAGTMGGLSDTAAASYAKFAFGKKIVTGVASRTVGEKSIQAKLLKGKRKIDVLNARINAFDKTATTSEEYNIGARLKHYNDAPDDDASEEQKQYFYKNREKYFNAAAVFRNPNSHSYGEKAKALQNLKELASLNPSEDEKGVIKLQKNVFKDINVTKDQILAISNLDRDVERMISGGMSRIDIENEVTLRLGVVFHNDTKEEIKDKTTTYFTALYLNGNSNSISMNGVKQEIKEILQEMDEIQTSIVFVDKSNPISDDKKEAVYEEVHQESEDIYEAYEELVSDYAGKSTVKEYAKNVAILMQRNSGVYTESDILAAASYLREHAHDNEAVTQMLEDEFDMDIDMFMHALARKVSDEPQVTSNADEYTRDTARRIVNDYEHNAREGYFDDEISVHQIMKIKHNGDEIDKILEENEEIRRIAEETYENKKKAMQEATEQLAEEFLAENQVSITEGSQDTEIRTQDGYTYEELLVKRAQAQGKILKDLTAINESSASNSSLGWIDLILKDYLDKKDAERTGITTKIKEEKTLLEKVKDAIDTANSGTASEYVEERKKKREEIDDMHYYGDIGDRK